MRFIILIFASLLMTSNLYVPDNAEAGVLIRRAAQSNFKTKKASSTAVLKSLPQPGGGRTFGTRKSINAVYKARLKAYKNALKQHKKEQKLAAKLEKAKKKAKEKRAKEIAKEKAKMEKELAKQRKEQEQIEFNKKEEVKDSGAKDSDKSSSDSSEIESEGESKSFLSKFTNPDKEGAAEKVKTKFKRSKLRFISRLFLSMFGGK